MLIAVLVFQLALIVAVIAVFLRKAPVAPIDTALTNLPDQLSRLVAEESRRTREDHAGTAAGLRTEVVGAVSTLGHGLKDDLRSFRDDNTASADKLRADVEQKMRAISQGFSEFKNETSTKHSSLEESLNRKLFDLMNSNAAHQDKLRTSVEDRLNKLNADNTAKLDAMRATVEEKLDKTLHSRLTASFGQVTTHLGEVQKGLGEMKELATGVGDLKKILSNVSRRGGVGEFLVGQQLEQMFSPEQYLKQVNVKRGTAEKVDFALKIPTGEPGSFVLLPIDSKFPTSDWERLEHAYEHGTAEEIAAAGKSFERSILAQGKSICEKYIDPPMTMPHAIMVLSTEALYAEAVRRPGLLSEIQSKCRVTVAGPSTFMAILTSFQMGFHTLAIQKKGDEVWNVLGKAKTEFGNFGGLMDKVEKQVGTVQNTLGEIRKKTATINRSLKDVSRLDTGPSDSELFSLDQMPGFVPLLAANEAED